MKFIFEDSKNQIDLCNLFSTLNFFYTFVIELRITNIELRIKNIELNKFKDVL